MTGCVLAIALMACLMVGGPTGESALRGQGTLFLIQADVTKELLSEDKTPERQESRSSQAAEDRAGDKPDGQAAKTPAADELQKQRERAGSIGLVLLGLVVGVGVFLLAFTVIWGHRVRRIARHRAGAKSAIDELWYLRHPPAAGSDISQDPLSIGGDEPDSDDDPARERDSEPES